MAAIGFACMNAVFAGFFSVLLRIGLRRVPDAEVATFVIAVIGLVTATLAAVAFGASTGELALSELWPFLIVGALAPGIGQLLYVHAVRQAGASRPAIVVAVAPLLSALLAVTLLDEGFGIALAVGTVLIVAGGAAIAWESSRPVDFKLIGIVLALVSAVFFSMRDIIVRWGSDETIVSPQVAMAAAFAAATVSTGTYLLVTARPRAAVNRVRAAVPYFLVAALILAIGQVAIFEALARGPVTVVVPLIGTHALWAVLFSVILLRQFEAIGPRIVMAALLVVTGGVLIGVFRSQGDESTPSRDHSPPALVAVAPPAQMGAGAPAV
jgi:uncharacterized membrane protein